MTRAEMMPLTLWYVLMLWALFLLPALTFAGIRLRELGRRERILIIVLFLADYVLYNKMARRNTRLLTGAGGAERLSAAGVTALRCGLAAGILLLITVLLVLLFRSVCRMEARYITAMTVRESMDNLPVGLCYYFEGGLLKLVNRRMDSLCMLMTGETLLDGEAFWEVLRNGSSADVTRIRGCADVTRIRGCADVIRIRGGEEPILRLRNGAVYSFRRKLLSLSGVPLYEISAVDVTEEDSVRRRLEEEQKHADAVRRRLMELNITITEMTVEKETLQAKTRIHDDWGRLLLMARRYLKEPESVDRRILLEQWKNENSLLTNEGPNAMREEYVDAVRDAWLMGIEVRADGVLPETSPARELMILALHTCVTNALRHAEGRQVFLKSRKEQGFWRVEIRNDGRAPEGPVKEGGGLGNLRRRVEAEGGSMEVRWTPKFVLMLRIPASGQEE